MSAVVEYTRDMGDGRVQVFSRSDGGVPFNVVVGRHLLNTDALYSILAVRAASVDGEMAAIKEHQARGVQ